MADFFLPGSVATVPRVPDAGERWMTTFTANMNFNTKYLNNVGEAISAKDNVKLMGWPRGWEEHVPDLKTLWNVVRTSSTARTDQSVTTDGGERTRINKKERLRSVCRITSLLIATGFMSPKDVVTPLGLFQWILDGYFLKIFPLLKEVQLKMHKPASVRTYWMNYSWALKIMRQVASHIPGDHARGIRLLQGAQDALMYLTADCKHVAKINQVERSRLRNGYLEGKETDFGAITAKYKEVLNGLTSFFNLCDSTSILDVENETFIHYTDDELGPVGSLRAFEECQQGLAYLLSEHVAGQRRQILPMLRFSAFNENLNTLRLTRNNEKCGVGEVSVHLSEDISSLLQNWKYIRAVPEGKTTVVNELIFIHCRATRVRAMPSNLLQVYHISHFNAMHTF